MKNLYIICLAAIFLAGYANAIFAENKAKETPPWMEDITTRERKVYLIPKGAKKEIIGSQVIVEDTDEYVARRLYEINKYLEERFAEIDQNYQNLRADVDELKNTVEDLEGEFSKEMKKNGEKEGDGPGSLDSRDDIDTQ